MSVLADPWGNYYFALEIDDVEVAHFREASGIKSSSTIFKIEEGGYNGDTHKRVGQSRWENIVLKKALTRTHEFEAWRDKYLTDDGWKERPTASGAIIVKNNAGEEMRRYIFTACWPVSWEGPTLNSGASDLGTETLEIAFDELYIDAKPKPKEEPPKKPAPKKFETPKVQFELDSDKLTPEGEATMAQLSKDIGECDVKEIWVEGHTCTLGPGGNGSGTSHAYNQDLSGRRANTCADYLKKDHPDLIIHSKGYSFDKSTASNDSPSGRSANRRTEFWTEPRSGLRAGESAGPAPK